MSMLNRTYQLAICDALCALQGAWPMKIKPAVVEVSGLRATLHKDGSVSVDIANNTVAHWNSLEEMSK